MKNKIRDTIHGFIELSDEELKIVDTKEFQRLRRIKQLATTYLVYPGAEHTRFSHSLGVMHLVSGAFDSALKNYKSIFGKDLFEDHDEEVVVQTENIYRQILRLIALLHDIGHPAFSHAGEGVFPDGVKHEDFTCAIIFSNNIKSIINEISDKYKHDNPKCDLIITPELLWDIYGNKSDELIKKHSKRYSDFLFLRSFMDSDMDCDKMDYLLRDSHYCGVNYGTFDLDRLIKCLTVYVENDGAVKKLAFMRNGIQAFEEFVLARYFMFIQVYFHRTRRFFDTQLALCMEKVFSENPLRLDDIDAFLKIDDYTLTNKIIEFEKKFKPAMLLINRETFECVYESGVSTSDPSRRLYNRLQKEVKEYFSGKDECENDYVFDNPSKTPHNIPLLSSENERDIPIIDKDGGKYNLMEQSIILSSLYNLIRIDRVYIDKKHPDLIQKIKKDYK